MREDNEYLLGTDDDELRRLGFQHQVWAREAAAAWERGGFGPGHHILDLGCGPGYATLDLARLVGATGRVTGVDVSARFVAHLQALVAKLGVGNVSAEVQDAETLELPPEHFDGAYARWVLTFVRRPDAVVAGVLDSLLVCPLTSDLGGERMYRVAMRPTAANGLHTPSEVMAEKVTAVTPGRVRQVIGRADDVTIAAVERALLFMFGIGVH